MELNQRQKNLIGRIYRTRKLKDVRDLQPAEFAKLEKLGGIEDLYLHINAHIKTLRKKDGSAGKIPWRSK